ncbi:hypothetical protein K3495_g9185 [Podosphaera aphanis]|nr:hypothetical protein K3495_g9185 [Podosphaera aphanis]
MSSNNAQVRAPGSFSSAMGQSSATRPAMFRVESASSAVETMGLRPQKPRLDTDISYNSISPTSQIQTPRPLYALSQGSNSVGSLQGLSFVRTTPHNGSNNNIRSEGAPRNNSHGFAQKTSNIDSQRHGKKNSSTQGSFEAYLPAAANGNLSSTAAPTSVVSPSHIAAQAAMQNQTHFRQRSQTVPTPLIDHEVHRPIIKGPANPPMLSVTEASGPYESGFAGSYYPSGPTGSSRGSVAQTAANVAFPKVPASSPTVPSTAEHLMETKEREKEKPVKSEKSKVKLFSRPGRAGITKEKETKAGPLPSPNRVAFASIQRGNHCTASVVETYSSSSSMYSIANSSSATIRPLEIEEKKVEKEKEKSKHHFLSRQKHKLTSKDEHNLPLSSAASNSKPVDPNAPSSLYNFNLPLSPSANGTFSKSMSGLDLRRGGRALRDRKRDKDEKSESLLREGETLNQINSSEWPGPSSIGSGAGTSFLAASSISYVSSICGYDATIDIAKNGLDRLGPEDAWPFLRNKLLAVFDGEDIRIPVEDLNRVVALHLQSAHRKRTPKKCVTDDLQDLLQFGFSSLDQIIRRSPEARLIPQLVEIWLFTLTTILPFMQAVFLPLDLELMNNFPTNKEDEIEQGDTSVRSMVLRSFRDVAILSRFETLRALFALNIEKVPSLVEQSLSSTSDSAPGRPGTSMSFEPSLASQSSQNTILLESLSQTSRSRAISNVSSRLSTESPSKSCFRVRGREYASDDGGVLASDMVGRMLQCIGVLASIHDGPINPGLPDGTEDKMTELVKSLKLNWLGRAKMERDRRGLTGARVRVPVPSFGAAIEV